METNVTLSMWPEADGLASSSPYCLKVLYALKYKKIPHRVEYAIHQLPKWMKRGKLPVAEIGAKKVEDSTAILRELDQLDSISPRLYPPDPDQNAETILLEEWADEVLTLPMVYYRWANPEHFAKFAPQVVRYAPEEKRQMARDAALAYHMEMFAERGISLASEEERQENYARAMGVLEQKLSRELTELATLIRARAAVLKWMDRVREFT